MLGDWFATALFWKPQAMLLVNQRTLLPVVVPLAPTEFISTRKGPRRSEGLAWARGDLNPHILSNTGT